jgi:hypothetical protein
LTWLWRILLYFAGEYFKGQVVLRAKRRGVVAYLKALQGTRHFVIFAVLAFFVFHAILLAGFGALITGMMLLDLDQRMMLMILCGVFSALFFIPVIALMVGLNERLWYRVSGAEKMVEELKLEREDLRDAA